MGLRLGVVRLHRPTSRAASPSGRPAQAPHRPALSPTQREIVDLFAEVVRRLGLSRSFGQIFGVIYCSPEPPAFSEIVERLGLSKGSVSRGLRFLTTLGAIRQVRVPGDRRARYVSEMELRRLMAGLLQTRVRAPLQSGMSRLKGIGLRLDAEDASQRAFLEQRIDRLQVWHRRALVVLPLIQSVLGARGV